MKILPQVLIFLFVMVDLQPTMEELIDEIYVVTVNDVQMKRWLIHERTNAIEHHSGVDARPKCESH